MADTNWQIVKVGHSDTRIMLDLRDPSASYFNIHYIDMAGDETYVEYVHNIDIFGGEERVEIDRISGNFTVSSDDVRIAFSTVCIIGRLF